MMNQLKKLTLFRLLILVIQSKKLTITQKLTKLKKKITDHDHNNKYITTQEVNELTADHFAARLAQVNLPSKNDIAAFVKKQILMIN